MYIVNNFREIIEENLGFWIWPIIFQYQGILGKKNSPTNKVVWTPALDL